MNHVCMAPVAAFLFFQKSPTPEFRKSSPGPTPHSQVGLFTSWCGRSRPTTHPRSNPEMPSSRWSWRILPPTPVAAPPAAPVAAPLGHPLAGGVAQESQSSADSSPSSPTRCYSSRPPSSHHPTATPWSPSQGASYSSNTSSGTSPRRLSIWHREVE